MQVRLLAAIVAGLAAVGVPAAAHHSFSGEFDVNSVENLCFLKISNSSVASGAGPSHSNGWMRTI
jgi:hypothetical protein